MNNIFQSKYNILEQKLKSIYIYIILRVSIYAFFTISSLSIWVSSFALIVSKCHYFFFQRLLVDLSQITVLPSWNQKLKFEICCLVSYERRHSDWFARCGASISGGARTVISISDFSRSRFHYRYTKPHQRNLWSTSSPLINPSTTSQLQLPSSQANSPTEFVAYSAYLSFRTAGDEPARNLKRRGLVWTPQLHKRFVDAVAHLEIKNLVH